MIAAVVRYIARTGTLEDALKALSDAVALAGGGVSWPVADNVFAVSNVVDPTKIFRINAAGQAPGTALTFALNATVPRTFRMPDIDGTAVVSQQGTGIVLVNITAPLNGSNAGVQYATPAPDRGIFQAFQYGVGGLNAPGFTGFKSRGVAVGTNATCIANDVIVRVTGTGVAPDTTVVTGGFMSLKVTAGFVPAAQAFLPTDLEIDLTDTAGVSATRYRLTNDGETQALRGVRAGGPTNVNLINGALWQSGSGSPEGAIVGKPGDIWSDLNGDFYLKKTGVATNIGWVLLTTPVTQEWHLNGDLNLATTDVTPLGALPANGGTGTFDGAYYVSPIAQRIVELRGTLRSPGAANTVDAEFIRLRGGAFFSLGIVSLVVTPFASSSIALPAAPDDVLAVGDIVFVRLRAIQTGTPSDLTLQLTTVNA